MAGDQRQLRVDAGHVHALHAVHVALLHHSGPDRAQIGARQRVSEHPGHVQIARLHQRFQRAAHGHVHLIRRQHGVHQRLHVHAVGLHGRDHLVRHPVKRQISVLAQQLRRLVGHVDLGQRILQHRCLLRKPLRDSGEKLGKILHICRIQRGDLLFPLGICFCNHPILGLRCALHGRFVSALLRLAVCVLPKRDCLFRLGICPLFRLRHTLRSLLCHGIKRIAVRSYVSCGSCLGQLDRSVTLRRLQRVVGQPHLFQQRIRALLQRVDLVKRLLHHAGRLAGIAGDKRQRLLAQRSQLRPSGFGAGSHLRRPAQIRVVIDKACVILLLQLRQRLALVQIDVAKQRIKIRLNALVHLLFLFIGVRLAVGQPCVDILVQCGRLVRIIAVDLDVNVHLLGHAHRAVLKSLQPVLVSLCQRIHDRVDAAPIPLQPRVERRQPDHRASDPAHRAGGDCSTCGQRRSDARQHRHDLAADDQHRPRSRSHASHPHDRRPHALIQIGKSSGQPGHAFRRPLHVRRHRLAEGDAHGLHCGRKRPERAADAALHGVGHLLCRTCAVIDVPGQLRKPLSAPGKQCLHRRQIGLIKYPADDVLALRVRHAAHGRAQLAEDDVQRPHPSLCVVHALRVLLNQLRAVLRGRLQRQNHVSQMGAALCALDARVGQNAQLRIELHRAARQRLGRAAHGQNGLPQLCDVGVGFLRSHRQLVGETCQLIHLQPQRGHAVRHQIGRIRQLHAARLRQPQHRRQRGNRLICVISGQRQIVERLRRL